MKFVTPKYKNLNRTGKILYVISFLLPILLLALFLYLYFLPFGLNKSISFTFEEIIGTKREITYTDSSFIYSDTSDSKKESQYIDGVLNIEYSPKLNILKANAGITIEGNNVYILPKHLEGEDYRNVWDYDLNLENTNFIDNRYISLNDYEAKDSELITFSMNFSPDWNYTSYPQLVLKYQNLKIILNETNIEFRADRLIDSSLISYNALYYFNEDEKFSNFDLIATYEQPTNNTNGYVEIYVNDTLGERTVIPTYQRLYDENIYTDENITTWSNKLIEDLSQEGISLGQEEFTEDLLGDYDSTLKKSINLYKYYSDLYQPEPKDNSEYSVYYYWGNWEDYFETDEDNYFHLIQTFYPKTFYNYFRGNIYNIKIGYEYPFRLKTSDTCELIDTPFTFFIYGENGTLEDINLTLSKDPSWKR